MLKLDLPDATDAKTLKTLFKAPEWAPHEETWAKAYANYLATKGNPGILKPATFNVDVAEGQRRLYDTRKGGGPIRRIRATAGLKCCPMCGSGTTGTLDHFLPRATYPEFSIFSRNLVPTCTHCNSGEKGATVSGDDDAYFLHPYFDTVAQAAIWQVRFERPLMAVRFTPVPDPLLIGTPAKRVAFHIGRLLGEQFDRWIDMEWERLPQRIRDRLEDEATITPVSADLEIRRQLREAVGSHGINSWPAAFLRGVLDDAEVVAHTAALADPLLPAPLP